MNKSFDNLISNLIETINKYDYFVDFKKVFDSIRNIEYKLNILNYLLGKENFDEEFKKTFDNNPNVVDVLPILLAIREKDISVFDNAIIRYDFNNKSNDYKHYLNFINKTGLIELFKDKRIKNLVDYVTGVEVGLDTNARKNRSGTQMENIVYDYLIKIPNIEIIKQGNFKDIDNKLGVILNIDLFDLNKNKRFDFIVKDKNNHIYLIETNYYRASGSKLNEVARSYTKLYENLKDVKNVTFIWITDGLGWKSTKNDLKKAFDRIDHLYNINDLSNNVLLKIFNK